MHDLVQKKGFSPEPEPTVELSRLSMTSSGAHQATDQPNTRACRTSSRTTVRYGSDDAYQGNGFTRDGVVHGVQG